MAEASATPNPAPKVDPAIRHLLARGDAPVPRDAAEARRVDPSAPKIEPVLEEVAHITAANAGGVPVRCYDPRPTPGAEERVDCVLWIHGGGFVGGSLDSVESTCRAIARRGGFVVVSVDYRLAPEHRFPAGLDDCEQAARWVIEAAGSLGIDPQHLFVGGTSAGGGLAAGLCLRLRDDPYVRIGAQALVYPCVDTRLTSPSAQEFATGHGLTRAKMAWYWEQYLGGAEPTPEAAPMCADDLSGLPRALVVLAECDVMQSEGVAYASRLSDAGVTARASIYPGMLHGFFGWSGAVPAADAAIDEVVAFFRS
ncbi:MAG: alpha/beta hydrolase [Actinomycetota bacterium]|nr:alpha/beta hydrolase [Actinomycetota bacterium]